MDRIKEFKNTAIHKIAVFKVWEKYPCFKKNISLSRVIFHDLGKMINILLLGDDLATKIHRALAGHHLLKTKAQKWEALLDWECARFTKPEKPLNGLETYNKFYSEITMSDVISEFKKEFRHK